MKKTTRTLFVFSLTFLLFGCGSQATQSSSAATSSAATSSVAPHEKLVTKTDVGYDFSKMYDLSIIGQKIHEFYAK